jgi:hypothetical protein
MGYEELEDPTHGHRHVPNDAVHFPILFELERAAIFRSPETKNHWYRPLPFKNAQLPEKIPNWGLRIDGEVLLPSTDGEGHLHHDFLVISALPNLFDPESLEAGRAVINIGGTHGVGTTAFKRLMEDEDALPALNRELALLARQGRPRYWQAVFQVELDRPGGKATHVTLMQKYVRKIDVA